MRRRSRGFIIVAVLWILGALALLASIYSYYVTTAAVGLGMHDERLRAETITAGGVELAVYRMLADPARVPTAGVFTFRATRATVAVEFRSEAARIDLNGAPKPLLAGLFAALGARAELADAYAERIVAWRSPAASGAVSDESAAYRAAGLSYGPRLGPFPHPGELALVLGLPELLVERALPFLTVYSGQGQVHLLDAPPEVLAALPGMDPQRLRDVLVQRQAGSQNVRDLVAALGPAQGYVTTTGSKAVRIVVRVEFESGRRMRTEAVILLSDGGTEPYHTLSWRDLDEAPDDPRPVRR
jgi:general secretion pathway protein K